MAHYDQWQIVSAQILWQSIQVIEWMNFQSTVLTLDDHLSFFYLILFPWLSRFYHDQVMCASPLFALPFIPFLCIWGQLSHNWKSKPYRRCPRFRRRPVFLIRKVDQKIARKIGHHSELIRKEELRSLFSLPVKFRFHRLFPQCDF